MTEWWNGLPRQVHTLKIVSSTLTSVSFTIYNKTTMSNPTSIVLPVPHYNQRNNVGNEVVYGDQMCNVTSLAMCAAFFGATPDAPFTQLEDQISNHFIDSGLSHYSPGDMEYGYNTLFKRSKDKFYESYTIPQIVTAIRGRKPCIIHGYFTNGGHIVVVIGFDEERKELCLNDPYGKWTPNGYVRHDTTNQNDTEGRNVWVPYETINRLCNDGGIWTHVISKV